MNKTITLANGKEVDAEWYEWYENGWDDLKNDPKWIDFNKEKPLEGQMVLCTYFKKLKPRQYKVFNYNDKLAQDIRITHWYPFCEGL